jgi:hypothetical protein
LKSEITKQVTDSKGVCWQKFDLPPTKTTESKVTELAVKEPAGAFVRSSLVITVLFVAWTAARAL